MNNNETNRAAGFLIARTILGFIFLMQGIGKVFTIGINNLYKSAFLEPFHDTFLPDIVLLLTAYYTSLVELIAGILLVVGLFRRQALYLLGSVLIIVSFGHGLLEPIWDLHHVVFRTIFVVALLLLPHSWDKYSLDEYLKSKRTQD